MKGQWRFDGPSPSLPYLGPYSESKSSPVKSGLIWQRSLGKPIGFDNDVEAGAANSEF